jgi:hypothetical protein
MRYLIILLFPVCLNAQSVGIGHSVKFWGNTPYGVEISANHKDFGFHILQNYHNDKVTPEQIRINSKTSAYAISYTPVRYKNAFLGGIVSNTNFPTYHATSLNFYVGFDINLNRFSIRYAHISNGFNLLHDQNLGYDSVTLYIKL